MISDIRKICGFQSSSYVAEAIDIAADELIALATPGQGQLIFSFLSFVFLLIPLSYFENLSLTVFFLSSTVDVVQLDRAKQSTKSSILMILESRVRTQLVYFLNNCTHNLFVLVGIRIL